MKWVQRRGRLLAERMHPNGQDKKRSELDAKRPEIDAIPPEIDAILIPSPKFKNRADARFLNFAKTLQSALLGDVALLG